MNHAQSLQAARNPVARAIANQRVIRSVRDFSTRLYLLKPGEDVRSDVMAASRALMACIDVMEHAGQGDSHPVRAMAAGIGAMHQIALRNFEWSGRDAGDIDTALQHVVDVTRAASTEALQQAWLRVDGREVTA